MVDHVRSVMPAFEQRLRAFADHPLVGDVRVCGLMGAIELVADKATTADVRPGRLRRRRGVRRRAEARADRRGRRRPATRSRSVRRSIITESEIDELFDRFELALADVEADVLSART